LNVEALKKAADISYEPTTKNDGGLNGRLNGKLNGGSNKELGSLLTAIKEAPGSRQKRLQRAYNVL
jgi:hypothetical protein